MMSPLSSKVYSGSIDLRERNSAWTKLVELVGHGQRVLEVGCARGYMSEFLARHRHCRVTGIEIDSAAAKDAAAHCETLVVGDVEKDALEQVTGLFDVITFADVLEHLRDPLRVLRAAHAYLDSGGSVLISLPNIAHWDVRRSLLFGRFEYSRTGILDDTHVRFFTYDTALRLIRDAGFEIDAWDVVVRCPRHWKYGAFYRRWERPINWLVRRFFRRLFGYQFVFKVGPAR